MTLVGIVDYGLGNLRSVAGAVERLGHEPLVSSDPAALAQASRLILPGVGAFGDGMAKLRARGLVEPLTELVVGQGRPVLGICLGAQLLARESEEFGQHEGLGWIDAVVRRIAPAEVLAPEGLEAAGFLVTRLPAWRFVADAGRTRLLAQLGAASLAG